VQILLDGGVNMEAKNALGETPLRHAVLGNKLGVFRLLHERGAAFALRCRNGSTALHDAILVSSHEALEFLLELRMRVDQKCLSTGQNALNLLTEHADLRTMQIFLEGADTGLTGLDITSRDEKDLTPLHYLNRRQDDNEFKHLFRLLLKRVQEARKEFDLLCVEGSKTPPNHVDESDKDDENDEFTDAVENQPEIWFSKQT
jgi:ankyrin repeat protein